MESNKEMQGIVYGAVSYMIWGIVPIYWKFLDHMNAGEILIHRVIWAFFLMLFLLVSIRKWDEFKGYCREIWVNKKKFWALFAASILVSANWGSFIWAVNAGRILDTSLGYYINPLVSVLLGVTVLKEKLTKAQIISVILAGIGVAVLTFHLGQLPWVSLFLALSFGLYGLVKVMVKADAAIGLTLETMMVTPIALVGLVYFLFSGQSTLVSSTDLFLLIGGGLFTALPLLLFAMGAKHIPLSMLGFLQYIAPTLSLLIGVFIYHEEFTVAHGIAFGFIWSGLLLYSISQVKMRHNQVVQNEKVV
ncbi:MAG: EamA family transporter RarD [Bacillus sp. (in: firmicutes)]